MSSGFNWRVWKWGIAGFGLRRKVMLAMGLVALLPLAALLLLHVRGTETVLRTAAYQSLLAGAAEVRNGVDDFLNVNRAVIESEARLPQFQVFLASPARKREALRISTRAVLASLVNRDRVFINAYFLLDSDGRVVIESGNDEGLGSDRANREYFRQARESGMAGFSRPEFDERGRARLVFSSPILDQDNHFLGVACCSFSMAVLQSLLTRSAGQAGEGSFPLLLDQENIVLAGGAGINTASLLYKPLMPLSHRRLVELRARHQLPPEFRDEYSLNMPELDQELAKRKQVIVDRIGYESVASAGTQPLLLVPPFSAHAGLDALAMTGLVNTSWVVIYGQPENVFLAPVRAQIQRTIYLALVVAMLVSGAALLLSYTLTSPIRLLSGMARKIAEGDFSARATSAARDEIGQLSRVFNDMAEQIAFRDQELRGLITALKSSERRLGDIIDHLPDATFAIDGQAKILAWNGAMELLTGVNAAAMIGKDSRECGLPFYGHRRSMLADLVFKPDQSMEKTYPVFHRDGNLLYAESEVKNFHGETITLWAKASPFYDDKGAIVGAVESVRDITPRITIERDLKEAKEQAEAATQAKSLFLANMSHELRTPLNAVIGYAQILARNGTDPVARDNVNRILRASEHLLGLINDVLSISAIESGRMTLNPAPFSTGAFFQAIENMVRIQALTKALDFTMNLQAPFPPVLRGDAPKLRQVLVNLLNNAIKFTNAGSVSLMVRRNGDRTRFDIHDTGIGISPDGLRRLFQRFEQINPERGRAQGTGLGLHISQSLVQLMDGSIEVESQIGRGSHFHFEIRLPLAEGVSEMNPELHRIKCPEAGQVLPKLLVVDDVEDNRAMLRDLFVSNGFEVHIACDGNAAVEMWEAQGPDVVWMDLRMPGMDGFEAVQQIRSREVMLGRGRTTLIALTASTLNLDEVSLHEAGFDDLVLKPVQVSELFRKLQLHCGMRVVMEMPAAHVNERLNPGDLHSVDPMWIKEFRRYLTLGEIDSMQMLLDRLADRNLAEALRAMIMEYRYEAITVLLGERGSDA